MPSFFKLCPLCGSSEIAFLGGKEFLCPECGFDYFHNVATASGVFLRHHGRVLFVARACEPAKGKLCLPGGFVDPGESAEAAVARECREELGIEPDSLEFIASFPNSYEYKGIAYNTCDFYFEGRIEEFDPEGLKLDPKEIAGVKLLSLDEVDEDEIAFPSLRAAISAYRKMLREGAI